MPKPSSLLRPGAILHPEDEVVYNFLVGRLLARIHSSLAAFQGNPDLGYQLRDTPAAPAWLKSSFESWREMRQLSLQMLEDSSFVVVSDIASFYDNIDLERLSSALKTICGDQPEISLLRDCLEKWATPRDKGIPQGHSASDILAKVYLNSLDRSLRNQGYQHLRYVDDIRIFCKSRLEAKAALRRLIELLHGRGLNVQAAKTKILSRAEAKPSIDGIAPTIEQIHKKFLDELQAEFRDLGPYIGSDKLAILLGQSGGTPVEVIERAFEELFLAPSNESFDKTLFHYLINRLAAARSRVAVDYCLNMLRARPEETEFLVKYFSKIDLEDSERNKILDYMASPDAIYDYQLYQLVRMFYELNWDDDRLLQLCRQWAQDSNREPWLRAYVLAFLGKWGDLSDLETLLERYPALTDEIEKAELIAALQRLERSRRNAFYARVQNESYVISRAVDHARRPSRKAPNKD